MSDRGSVLVVVGVEPVRRVELEEATRAPLAAARRLATGLELSLDLLWVAREADREPVDPTFPPPGLGIRCFRTTLAGAAGEPGAFARRASAVGRWARTRGTRHVLLGHDYAAVEALPALAGELDASMVSALVELDPASDGSVVWTRPVHQGKLIERLRSAPGAPVVATVRGDGAFDVEGAEPSESAADAPAWIEVELGIDEAPGDGALEWLGDESAGDDLDLAAARRIVSVGRGLGDPDRLGPIRELCVALDARLAGSRPVVDAGWLSRPHQVGSSGAAVSPDLYIALGISGSAQHLAGMSTARSIVAVNQDPEAPIFRVARFGVVGDLHEVVAQMLDALADEAADGAT